VVVPTYRPLLIVRTRVGDGCSFGAGPIVIPYESLGDHVAVGAGAVVINDLQPNKTVFGVPARPIVQARPE
jgi:serine O-acetyltransferase